jgi:thiaminase/transcriptional activator TenA
MTISSDLWQENQDLAQACLKHPFVQGIANGTLHQQRFAYYVGQDAFFLEAFARAYSIAAAKAPDAEGFKTFHSLAGGVLDELFLHQGYADEWGVNLQTVEPGAATRRYTDFLLATAWSSEVGQYTNWIRTYSSEEFEQLAQKLENLADRYASTTASLKSTYRYAMLCERDFFQAAWEAIDLKI